MRKKIVNVRLIKPKNIINAGNKVLDVLSEKILFPPLPIILEL